MPFVQWESLYQFHHLWRCAVKTGLGRVGFSSKATSRNSLTVEAVTIKAPVE